MESNLQENRPPHIPLGVSGLGGWLVLIQIGLYLSIINAMVLIGTSPALLGGETWEMLTSKATGMFYHPLWEPLILFETIINSLLLIFLVYILVLFYRKKRLLPRMMIIMYSASLIITVADIVLLYQIPLARELHQGGVIREVIRSILTCAIWIPYFLKSERVENTFIR